MQELTPYCYRYIIQQKFPAELLPGQCPENQAPLINIRNHDPAKTTPQHRHRVRRILWKRGPGRLATAVPRRRADRPVQVQDGVPEGINACHLLRTDNAVRNPAKLTKITALHGIPAGPRNSPRQHLGLTRRRQARASTPPVRQRQTTR